jgi:hypothetical protein
MFLKILLIIVAALLLGLFVNYYRKHISVCEECKKNKKSSSAWENLNKENTEPTEIVNDLFNDDSD